MGKPSPIEKVAYMRRQATFRLFEQKFKAEMRITVGSATCENAAGANEVYQRFKELISKHEDLDIVLSRVGCAGKCDMEPVVTIVTPGTIPLKYVHMDAEKVDRVFESHVLRGEPVEELGMRHEVGIEHAERLVGTLMLRFDLVRAPLCAAKKRR